MDLEARIANLSQQLSDAQNELMVQNRTTFLKDITRLSKDKKLSYTFMKYGDHHFPEYDSIPRGVVIILVKRLDISMRDFKFLCEGFRIRDINSVYRRDHMVYVSDNEFIKYYRDCMSTYPNMNTVTNRLGVYVDCTSDPYYYVSYPSLACDREVMHAISSIYDKPVRVSKNRAGCYYVR